MVKEKTFYIENLGCFRNQVDAEYIIASMEQAGYTHLNEPEGASAIVVNSCGFIESAKEESINTFFQFREAYPESKIILAGCLAQRYGNELSDMLPEADGFFGNRAPELLPQIMKDVEEGKKPSFFPQELTTAPKRIKFLNYKKSAFVKIAEGCIHHCTFCAIPKIRGGLVSRNFDDVVREVNELLDEGIFEVNLIAQDLASFGLDRGSEKEIIPLLRAILKRPGNYWIRPFYIHPDTFPEGLIELCQEDSRLLPYFDLPFQHANQKVLKMMARYGNSQVYLDLIQKIRTALPQAVVRSTFLVGFPGENTLEFQELLDFQEKAQIDWMGVFAYSREDGTSSFRLQTDEAYERSQKDAHKRKVVLERRQNEITAKRLDLWLGRTVQILIEEPIEGSDMYLGRAFFQAPEVDGLTVVHARAGLVAGELVTGEIFKRNGVDLEAREV